MKMLASQFPNNYVQDYGLRGIDRKSLFPLRRSQRLLKKHCLHYFHIGTLRPLNGNWNCWLWVVHLCFCHYFILQTRIPCLDACICNLFLFFQSGNHVAKKKKKKEIKVYFILFTDHNLWINIQIFIRKEQQCRYTVFSPK